MSIPESTIENIVVLAGGVGGSRFVRGVRAAYPKAQITVIGNTADDITLHGLRICPDLDTMLYALGDGIDDSKGWGRRDETWSIMDELKTYGVEPTWFALGDRDIATHLIRTQLMLAGATNTEITKALSARWLASDPLLELLPMTDDRVETHIIIADPQAPGGRRAVHFQEYWVRLHAEPEVLEVLHVGLDKARATAEVAEAITRADVVLFAPSNPVVSLGPILKVAGVRPALRACRGAVVGFSGILGGRPVLGMADKLLPAIGVEVDAAAVGEHFGARPRGGLLDAWLVDAGDAAYLDRLAGAGLAADAVPLLMSSPQASAEFIRRGVQLGVEAKADR